MDPTRRAFLGSTLPPLAFGLAAADRGAAGAELAATLLNDRADWRSHFPALQSRVNGHPLIYFDTAATAQRPRAVIETMSRFYEVTNANPGSTLHTRAREADGVFQAARARVARFINAADPLEVVWTRGTTESINLVATAWGGAQLRPGDEVVLTLAEHASCMLPWQLAATRAGAVVRYMEVDDEGRLTTTALERVLSDRTRMVCFTHVSNVTGAIAPARELCEKARAAGARVLVDAAQSVPHIPVDVQEIGCDFLAFSSHKLMGPMGTGVLWARREVLDQLPPYQSGSNAAHRVTLEDAEWGAGALRFGAGTPNVAGAVGMAAALDFLEGIGFDGLMRHERQLTQAFLDRLAGLKGLRLLGPASAEQRIALFTFVHQSIAPATLVGQLDHRGIAIRSGDLAALPLLRRLGAEQASRASLYLYNTKDEVRILFEELARLVPA